MDRSWKPDRRKVGNEKQLLFAERYTYTDGKAAGLRCVAVTVGELEAVFCEDRALCRPENKEPGLSCRISYDTSVFPVTLQWKSMVSGNDALGIEPSTTRFDIYTPQPIAPGEAKRFEIDLQLSHRVD